MSKAADWRVREAARILDETEAVLPRGFPVPVYFGAPLGDVVALMGHRAYATFDIAGGHEPLLDGVLARIGLGFVREGGVCRKSSGYRA